MATPTKSPAAIAPGAAAAAAAGVSSIYERVVNVISKPPALRTPAEINSLLPWLRKKAETFRNVSHDVIYDIIKECTFTTADIDDVIIKQGDRGDRFYVILRGSVSVLINTVIADEDDVTRIREMANTTSVTREQHGRLDRDRFGTSVEHMGVGRSFGEVALLTENCIRQASIICDESTDLLVVDRDLYNRSLHSSQAAEFAARVRFVEEHPLFQRWPQQHRRQMAMSIQWKRLQFDHILVRQGDPVTALYFLHKGQGKVVIDPGSHLTQYPQLQLTTQDSMTSENDDVVSHSEATNTDQSTTGSDVECRWRKRKRRRHSRRRQIEVCIVGKNDIIGDVEFALGLRTYMQTVVCDQTSEFYFLSARNYERLIVRKHVTTGEMVQKCVQLKLQSRVSRPHLDEIQIFRVLLNKITNRIMSNSNATANSTTNITSNGNTVLQRFTLQNGQKRQKQVMARRSQQQQSGSDTENTRPTLHPRPMMRPELLTRRTAGDSAAETAGTSTRSGPLTLLCATSPGPIHSSLPPTISKTRTLLGSVLTGGASLMGSMDAGLDLIYQQQQQSMTSASCMDIDDVTLSKLEDRLIAWQVAISHDVTSGSGGLVTSLPGNGSVACRTLPVIQKLKRIDLSGREPFHGSKVVLRPKQRQAASAMTFGFEPRDENNMTSSAALQLQQLSILL